MTRPLNVVALSGGTWRPSRTLVLTQAVLAELATLLPIQATLIELGDIARPLGGALSRDELPAEVEAQLLSHRTGRPADRRRAGLSRLLPGPAQAPVRSGRPQCIDQYPRASGGNRRQ